MSYDIRTKQGPDSTRCPLCGAPVESTSDTILCTGRLCRARWLEKLFQMLYNGRKEVKQA